MKLLKVSAVALLAAVATTGAYAADLLIADDVIAAAAPVSDWDGFYAGIGIGYEDWSGPGATDEYTANVHIGVNATAESFLFGAEAYLLGYRLVDGSNSGYRVGAEARLGYLVSDAVLLYVTGGAEWDSMWAWQGTLGAGLEFMVAENISLDLDYHYKVDIDSPAYTAHVVGASVNWHF